MHRHITDIRATPRPGECFNCGDPSTTTRTIAIGTATKSPSTLDVPMCPPCARVHDHGPTR